jgi:serine/threonine-protein kinase
MLNLIGQAIGQYQIIEEIGRGGMAVIYRAEQPTIGRDVAIKFLRQGLPGQEQNLLARFFREAQIVANLQHPHILPVYDFGEFNGLPYLVMAYMPSGTLADYIEGQGQLRLPETVRLVRQISDALDYAHRRGVIHRDVKPSNILMDEPGNAYLADFGLSKALQRSDLTASGLIGTPDYIAPDWGQGAETSPSVDIYALGVTLYQMLAGELPFQSTSPMGVLMAHLNDPIPDLRRKRSDLPEAVQPVLEIAMAKSADERYATAGSLADALEKAQNAGTPAVSLRIPSPPLVKPPIFPAIHFYFNLLAARDVLGEDQLNGVLLLAGLESLIGNFESLNFEEDIYPVEQYAQFWKTIFDVYGSNMRSFGKLFLMYMVSGDCARRVAWPGREHKSIL